MYIYTTNRIEAFDISMRFYKEVEEATQKGENNRRTRHVYSEKKKYVYKKKIMKLNDFGTLGVPKIRPYFRFTLCAQKCLGMRLDSMYV